MRILGHGIDLTSVKRMREILDRHGEALRQRVFTETECAYCDKHRDSALHYAARFAAKEAFAKATGWGLADSGALGGVSVKNEADGRPVLELNAEIAARFKAWGGREHFISLSHDGDMAIASVILVGE